MSLYRIESVQELPIPIEQAWEFFSNPENLSELTPGSYQFSLSNGTGKKMYAGQLLVYKVYPFFWLKRTWVAEIVQLKEQQYFIDQQVSGPFKFWRHEHHFTPTDGGVIVRDILYYRMPYGWLGRLVHALFVGRKLDRNFVYRKDQLRLLFGA